MSAPGSGKWSGRTARASAAAVLIVVGAAVAIWRGSAPEPYPWRPPGGEIEDVGGLRVRWIDGDGPTIVLLHGLGGSQRYFGADFDALAAYGRLVAPDLLGFGGSPKPESARYDASSHARAVRRALEEMGGDEPIVLVGHSAGSLVAIELAAEWPERVRSVIAFAPPLYRSPASAREHIADLGAQVRWFAMDGLLARPVCEWLCRHREVAARLFGLFERAVPDPITADATQHTWTSYSRTLRNLIIEGNGVQALERVRVPVYWIAGQQDPVVDLPWLRELARRLPLVRLTVWPGNHDLPLAQPRRSVEAVRGFLTDLGEPPGVPIESEERDAVPA